MKAPYRFGGDGAFLRFEVRLGGALLAYRLHIRLSETTRVPVAVCDGHRTMNVEGTMSKKKTSPGGKSASGKSAKSKSATPNATASTARAKKSPLIWIIAAVVLLGGIFGAVALLGSGSKGGAPAGIDPAEAKYIGRLLPADYEEPKLADIVVYTETTPMTDAAFNDAGDTLELDTALVTEKRNVYAEYTRADGKKIPVMAYLKPSGKLFVGISFCPPCEGERQRIETDGTLTCESCGTKRTLETGVGISGTCKLYPLDELPVTVKDGKIAIEKSLFENWVAQPLDRPVG